MLIGHCIHGLGLGGAQQVIKHIIARRDDEAFRHIVYSCESGVFHQPIEAVGGAVRIVPRRIPKFDPLWVAGLARAFGRDGVELLHVHLFGDSLHGYLAARRQGIPVVMTLHCTADSRTGLQRRGYRWLLARCAASIACAEFVRRTFLPLAAGRTVETIPNGIELPVEDVPLDRAARLARLGIPPTARVVAGIGRLVPFKGFEHLVEAFSQLPRSEQAPRRLLLLGDGPMRQALAAQAQRLGIADELILAGFRDDIPTLLPALDVVAFSSLYEGLPMALLEAMASARAIVATTVGGIPDVIRHRQEGLLVPAQDSAALAAALTEVFADQDLAGRLGAAAAARFEAGFTAATMVRRYEALYRRVKEKEILL